MKNLFVLLAVILALHSCKEQSSNPEAKNYSEIKKADWLLGRWENNLEGSNLSETWTRENDSVLVGETFVVVETDTVFREHVSLKEENGGLHYIVSVPGQNKDKPVAFGLTSSADGRLVFENPKHDYPNKIVYRRITNDSIVASISGMREGKETSEEFAMKKAND